MLDRIVPSHFLTAMNPIERWLARIALLMVAFAVIVAVLGPLVVGLTGAAHGKTVVVVLVVVSVIVATGCLAAWGLSTVIQGLRLARRDK